MSPLRPPTYSVIEGDCFTLLDALPTSSVDVIVTSPPYNIGVTYGSYADKLPKYVYTKWLAAIATKLERVLKANGSLFVNFGGTSKDPWLLYDYAQAFRIPFILQNNIVWVKSLAVGAVTHGHFKPVNSKRFLNNTHESIFHFTKSGSVPLARLAVGVPFMDKSNIDRRSHTTDKRCAGNVWFIPYKTVQSAEQKFNHPAGFPLELPLRCLKLHGASSGLVLDPFAGTGTTLVAAKQLGLSAVGFELDAAYANTARQRLTDNRNQPN